MMHAFFDSMLQLITRTSTELPPDVRQAMKDAAGREAPGTNAAQAMSLIALNIDQASADEGPICQDTGMPTFEVKAPVGVNQIWMQDRIREAIAEQELENHRQQMKHAEEIERFLNEEGTEKKGKKTNKALYAWMKREVKGLYGQCFKSAFVVSKESELALQRCACRRAAS